MVENACERIPPRALGQLPGHPLDVGDDTAVERPARLALAMTVEDAPEDQQLCRHLGGRQAEAFALAGVVFGELTGLLVYVQARDERGQGAQLPEPAETLERRDDAVGERLLDALDREIPGGCPHDPG